MVNGQFSLGCAAEECAEDRLHQIFGVQPSPKSFADLLLGHNPQPSRVASMEFLGRLLVSGSPAFEQFCNAD